MKALKYYKDLNNSFYTLKICTGMSQAEKPHLHDELAIAYVCSGESTLYFENFPHKIHAGQMVVISPGFVHHCIPVDSDSWGYIMLLVSADWLNKSGFPSDNLPSFTVLHAETESSKPISLSVEKLKSKPFNADEIILEFLDTVMQQLDNMKYSIATKKISKPPINRVITYLSEDLSKPIQLEKISSEFQISKYTLIRLFRQAMNTTPQKYHLMLRLNKSKSMLESGRDIIDTALEYGFYDQSHFSKSFKSAFGLPPKTFQDSINTK